MNGDIFLLHVRILLGIDDDLQFLFICFAIVQVPLLRISFSHYRACFHWSGQSGFYISYSESPRAARRRAWPIRQSAGVLGCSELCGFWHFAAPSFFARFCTPTSGPQVMEMPPSCTSPLVSQCRFAGIGFWEADTPETQVDSPGCQTRLHQSLYICMHLQTIRCPEIFG